MPDRDTPPAPRPRDRDRRKVVRAVRLWAAVTLSGVVAVAALVIGFLVRRGRLIRAGLAPPRRTDLSEYDRSKQG
jgi:hypothetical protein